MCYRSHILWRGPLLLLLASILVLAGCGASDKPQTAPITPKAGYEISPCDENYAGSGARQYDPAYQAQSGGQPDSQAGWSQAEREAASFIHNAPIYFHYDRSALTEEARAVLRQKAKRIRAFPQFLVTVAGHCDERGTANYNYALGGRRAQAAVDYLVSQGVPRAQLHTTSFGKSNPSTGGQNESAWSRNRRDDFHVSKR